MDTGCSLKDLPVAINDKGERERENQRKFVLSARLDDDDDDDED